MDKFVFLTAVAALVWGAVPANGIELSFYGVAHLSVDNVNDGDDASVHTASNSSRLGFVGQHVISPSLTLLFQFETGMDPTAQGENDGNGGADSSGQIFTKGRPSYVGLLGVYGKILLGHMPALDQWANDYNLFADQVGDLGNLWEGSGVPGRLDNVIYYLSPKYGGFDVAVSYVAEEGVDDEDHFIVKSSYEDQGLKLGLALASIGQGLESSKEHNVVAVTVGYNFGSYSVGGGFQRETNIRGESGNDRSSFTLGGSRRVGKAGVVKLQVGTSEGEKDSSDAVQFAVGYDYDLDASTRLYVAYSSMNNDSNVDFSANGKGHGDKIVPALGDDPSALSLGVVYTFNSKFLK